MSTTLCILGCGGFIGSHLLNRLLSTTAYTVIGIDTNAAKIAQHLHHERFSFFPADIYTSDAVQKSIQRSDIVISLAALCNPALYNTIPLRIIENNFTQPCSVVQMCTDMGKWLIHFSTCEVYGRTIASYDPHGTLDSAAVLSEETTPCILGPIAAQRWTYACAKQLLERYVYAQGEEHGLAYTIVRPFNFIGPHMDYIPGIDGEGVPRVIACFMDALLFNKPLKLVDGGKNRRTFTYIDDAVDAVMAMLVRPERAKKHIFNIGNPANELSIEDLAHTMSAIYKKLVPNAYLPEIIDVTGLEFYGKGYEDSDRRIPDIHNAQTLLGWNPVVPLSEALLRTIAAYIDEYASKTA